MRVYAFVHVCACAHVHTRTHTHRDIERRQDRKPILERAVKKLLTGEMQIRRMEESSAKECSRQKSRFVWGGRGRYDRVQGQKDPSVVGVSLRWR